MTPQIYIDQILLPFVRAVAKGDTSVAFHQSWAHGILAFQPEAVAPATPDADSQDRIIYLEQLNANLSASLKHYTDLNEQYRQELPVLRRERNDAVHVIRSLQSIAKSFHTKDNRP